MLNIMLLLSISIKNRFYDSISDVVQVELQEEKTMFGEYFYPTSSLFSLIDILAPVDKYTLCQFSLLEFII